MLPPKVRNYVDKLQTATDNDEISWASDLDEAEVAGAFNESTVKIRYRFDELSELGVYYIRIIDKNGKEGAFEASQEYSSDYEKLRILFDSAHSCDSRKINLYKKFVYSLSEEQHKDFKEILETLCINDFDKFRDWIDDYSHDVTWNKFNEHYMKCNRCGYYDTEPCICYAR